MEEDAQLKDVTPDQQEDRSSQEEIQPNKLNVVWLSTQDPPKREKKERLRSDVWQFFTKLDNVKATCQICDKTYSHAGNTTNLFWHLKRKHQMEVGCVSLSSPKISVNHSNSDQDIKATPTKRGRSEVWQYFEKEDAKTARCIICHKILSHSGNTSNLLSHVKHKHSDIRGTIQTVHVNMEESPTEILPDDSHSMSTDVQVETPIILRRSRTISDEHNVKFVEACSRALENEMKSEVGYEVINLNGDTKFIQGKENGISYITKVIPKSTSPVVIGEYDAVGLNVGAKLKKMEPSQAIFAESLINRILLRGLMENLTCETDLYDKNVYVIQNVDGRGQEAITYDSPAPEEGVEASHS